MADTNRSGNLVGIDESTQTKTHASEATKAAEAEQTTTTSEPAPSQEGLGITQNTDTVPDKFRDEQGNVDVEKLLKSYNELEKSYYSKNKKDEPAKQSETSLSNAFQDPELNAKYQAEYLENGALSKESIKELGFPEALVNEYLGLKLAESRRFEQEVKESIGGEEGFLALSQWAVTNLSEGEILAYNNAVNQGGETAKLAVQGVYAKYKEGNSNPPSKRLSGSEILSKGDVYYSQQDLLNDMMSPEYKRSPEFQAKVQEKLSRSNI